MDSASSYRYAMDMQSSLSLRITLFLTAVLDGAIGILFAFQPASILPRVYGLLPVTPLELYLAQTRGIFFCMLALGALLSMLRPQRQNITIVLLFCAHFALFIGDIIVTARGHVPFWSLATEMAAFILVAGALVRFYPAWGWSKEAPAEEVIEEVPTDDMEVVEDTTEDEA